MVTVRLKELEHKLKELKYMKSGGHEAEDQKQIRTSSMWINDTGSVHMKQVLQSWLINTVYHLLILVFPLKRGLGEDYNKP